MVQCNEMNFPLLEALSGGKRLESMNLEEKKKLSAEIRNRINSIVRENGGHLGPNLGCVEIIVACHSVFQLDKDRLIFDVGHQVYPHKLLTGRHEKFDTLRKKGGISGYPFAEESPYDVFRGGHASTAISTALGLKTGYEISKLQTKTEEDRHVIALVGDGSLTGGMAFEALNQCGELNQKLIVILNDNSMSISPTVGGLARASKLFRHSTLYNKIRDRFLEVLKRIPHWGENFETLATTLLREGQNLVTPAQMFSVLGLEYFGPVDGNSIEEMTAILNLAKQRKKPVLIHALTQKGFGYKPQGPNSTAIIGPHALSPGQRVKEEKEKLRNNAGSEMQKDLDKKTTASESYSKCFAQALIDQAKRNEKVIAVTAAMPEGTALVDFQKEFPKRYFDVGICEAHATGFCAGLVSAGMRPVFAVYSTFLQRAFDQIFHEVVLQKNLPVVFAIDRAGLVGDDGPSHHGSYDIAYLRIFPNFIIMAPADGRELKLMVDFALRQSSPVALRYPRLTVPKQNFTQTSLGDQSIVLGKSQCLLSGKDVCIIAYGSMVETSLKACALLEKDGFFPTLINARFVKPLDGEMLQKVYENHDSIITIEEGVLPGGFGSAVVEWYTDHSCDTSCITRMGLPDRLVEHATRQEQLVECELSEEIIAQKVKKFFQNTNQKNTKKKHIKH